MVHDWKTHPATKKQKAYAKDLNIVIPPNATKGEASALIHEALENSHNDILGLSLGNNRSILARFADLCSTILSITASLVSLILAGFAVHDFTQHAIFGGVVKVAAAIAITYYGTKWKRNRISGKSSFSGMTSAAQSELKHAIEGTFEKSYFTNPKTGNFSFPKYRHENHYLIRITDNTDYRTEFWDALDADEKRNYTLSDFEHEFDSSMLDLEVEPIDRLFYKPTTAHLEPLAYLKDQWSVVETIIMGAEQPWILVDPASKTLNTLLKEGFLYEQLIISHNDKLDYFNSFPFALLKNACKTSGITVNKSKKRELIDHMIQSQKSYSLPKAAVPGPRFYEWFEALISFYISEIHKNAKRFHPLYHEQIWTCAVDNAEIPQLKHRLQAVLESRYWLTNLRK